MTYCVPAFRRNRKKPVSSVTMEARLPSASVAMRESMVPVSWWYSYTLTRMPSRRFSSTAVAPCIWARPSPSPVLTESSSELISVTSSKSPVARMSSRKVTPSKVMPWATPSFIEVMAWS